MILLALTCSALAAEEKSIDDYQTMIGTYSIDASVPGYGEYLARYNTADRPAASILLEAAEYARYLDESGAAASPAILMDWEGMAGPSLLMDEGALVEYSVSVTQTGLL